MAKILVAVSAQVVHDVVDHCIWGMHTDMGSEHPTQGVPIMVGGALTGNFSSGRIEEGKQISGPISAIVKVLEGRLAGRRGQRGGETGECLNTCALIETIQILRKVGIASNDVFHLGKEIRVCDLEIVLTAVGSKGMFQENPMNG